MFKTLLVHLDQSIGCGLRLDAAISYAQTHDAHVSGFYPIPDCTVPASVGEPTLPELYQILRDSALADADQSRSTFAETLDRAGVNGDWRSSEGGPAARKVGEASHCVDLVVIGQTLGQDPAAPDPGLAGGVVLHSSAPVVILPNGWIDAKSGIGARHVLIGWKDSREAARAVSDALPLLAEAEQVTVVTVAPDPAALTSLSNGEDLAAFLALHGVRADVQVCRGNDTEASQLLIDRAQELSCDLMVTGGYSHSRLRELILGGVTRHLLEYAPMPVLMSH